MCRTASHRLGTLLVLGSLLLFLGIPPAFSEPTDPVRLHLPLVSGAGSRALTLIANADATIYQDTPLANEGTGFYLHTGNDHPEEDGTGAWRSVIRFELPEGQSARIATATLRIYYAGYWDFPHRSRVVQVEAVAEPWSETTITWADQPLRAVGTYGSVSINSDDPTGYRDVDVTELVQAWLNGTTPNHGLYLIGPEMSGSDASLRTFFSRETIVTDSPYPPTLVIKF